MTTALACTGTCPSAFAPPAAQAASQAKKAEKEKAKAAAEAEKAEVADKKVAKATLDLLAEPLGIFTKAKDAYDFKDEYQEDTCESLQKKVKKIVEAASKTVIDGSKVGFDLKAVRDMQSELARTLAQ